MNLEEVIQSDKVDFSGIPSSYYLIGLLSAFENRFQGKQFFAIICINMCKEPPTLKELSDILGSSHQNVKQILLKLEKKDFIRFEQDESDKRKQRIVLTKTCKKFCEKNDDMSQKAMMAMFEGISERNIKTTIQTIIKIEKNLKGILENE